MTILNLARRWMALVVCLGSVLSVAGQVVLNELLFNPPSAPDYPHEYIELRGPPNYVLPAGTYLLTVDGDLESNPGSIENVFDLSGRLIGGNGFLVLLQKTNTYVANPRATILQNTNSEPGWGSGSGSSIRHRGESGENETLNASVTFFLVRSNVEPRPGDDVDRDNNGWLDGIAANWVVLDSVGVLDNTGAGDFAYGEINFRRGDPPGNGATASGLIVSVNFTPKYIGRTGNTAGSAAADWLASNDLLGTAPNWTLHDTDVMPPTYVSRALNHVGSPNFGAVAINGVVLNESGGETRLVEGATGTDTYTLALNTRPNGPVRIQATASSQLQLSTNSGISYSSSVSLTFTSTTPQTITVRVLDDNVVNASPHSAPITHRIVSTGDATRYPTNALIPTVQVQVVENEWLLLSELKVNPPGTNDAPFEFIEIRGPPNAQLGDVYLLGLDGKAQGNPGEADLAVDLRGEHLGSLGIMLVVADGHPYSIPSGCSVFLDSALAEPGGALGNNSVSFLLVSNPDEIRLGADLDDGDNGVLEGLHDGTTIWDAVGWRADPTNDVVYGGVVLANGTLPDAAARFPGNLNPRDATAWYYGDLSGEDGLGLEFDRDHTSANFPTGTSLSPGLGNNTAPAVVGLRHFSGAIGDPTNPRLTFSVNDLETGTSNLSITVRSTNPGVVPDQNLVLTGASGQWTLAIEPMGVGYADIILTISDGTVVREETIHYAASDRGASTERYHFTAADASTAIPLDENFMLIGDDENQLLRIYSRSNSGWPIVGHDFTPFLELTDIEAGRPREVDIEASTRVDDRIYWIGAHSHANIAEGRTNRSRLFTTGITGSGTNITLTYLGRYDFLKLDLANWDANNRHGKGAHYYGLAASTEEGVNPKDPDGAGFNIEGLTMAPHSASIGYIACRAPIVPATNRTHALIIPVLNFAELATSTGPAGSAVFGEPIELDLYGRGIRSIERVDTNYLFVAGIPGDFPGEYPRNFALYTWSGLPGDPPQMRGADLTGMNPEGIVELPAPPWSSNSVTQLLNDCGRRIWYNDNIPGKEIRTPGHKKFSTQWVALGPVVQPQPVIVDAQLSASGVTIWWRAVKNMRYRLQYKPALNAPTWTELPGEIVASGPVASKLDATAAGSQRFYRVLCIP